MRDLEDLQHYLSEPDPHEMKDLTQRLRMLRDDAEECLLISRLATDQTKRQTFRKLATQLEEMAAELGAVIAAKRASGATRPAPNKVGETGVRELRESLRARLDAILDQTCSSLVNRADHDIRKYVAERLAEAARSGITHAEELSVVARRALLELANGKAV